jgi:predicted transcriptional regulator
MALLKQSGKQETGELFARKADFWFVELGRSDAQKQTDNFKILRELIVSSQNMYPAIERWFDTKVVAGIKSSERVAWVAYEGEKAIASAVLKLGEKSKFCHLRVHEDFHDMDLGQMFFTQMTLEARHLAKEIHFTLPESLWCTKSKFFESFGFSCITKSRRQYRHGDVELSCSAPLGVVHAAVLKKLPTLMSRFNIGRYSLLGDILISIKPKYADQILTGTKLVEIRKKFSKRWVGCRAVLYSSSPQKALVGEATVRSVTFGNPMDVWAQFGTSIGCSSSEFNTYVGTATEISAIELDEVIPYKQPVSLAQVSHLVQENLRPPQSFCDLRIDDKESAWAKATSMASLLHGRFSPFRHIPANPGQ